jgi:hypothetical protein
MPFVNEYISRSDIEKYGLAKAYFAANPGQTELPEDYRPHWTIDRERKIIFRQMRGANPARDGEYWIEFLLEMGGQRIFIKIDRIHGSKKLSDTPYLIAWGKIIDVYPNDLEEDRLREVMGVLKEALTARGYDGARKQIPNTIVTFDF